MYERYSPESIVPHHPHIAVARRFQLWLAAVGVVAAVLVGHMIWPERIPLSGEQTLLGPATILLLFFSALVCEYIDSSLGMGYGTTLTPLLLIAGFEPLQIVPAVLLSEFVSGVGAAAMHHKDGNVDFLRDPVARKTALMLTLLSVAGVTLAVAIAVRIPKFWLTFFIAAIIITMGVVIIATRRRRIPFKRGNIIALGTIAAFNKALSGGGYGPLVTAGQVVSGISAKQAIAVTSLAEGFTCFAGLIVYAIMRGAFDWRLAIPLALGAVLSVPMATLTVKRLPEKFVRTSIGIVTLMLGFLTLYKLLS